MLEVLSKNGLIVYLSGAITNDPDYVQKFISASLKYEGLGYIVYNPVKVCEGISNWKLCMKICYEVLKKCHFVAVLERDIPSKGRDLEVMWSRRHFKIPVVNDQVFDIKFQELDYERLLKKEYSREIYF